MNIENLYCLYLKYPIICTDTRKIYPESIFFALKGDNFNGNSFAENALALGCAYVVIDQQEYKRNDQYILVPDVLKCLQELAIYHRKQLTIPIIGITGTNGKTTTKELLSAILGRKYNIIYTKGNFNNHIGVPLTVLSIGKEHNLAVIEMGANHPGEIGFLCNICKPTHGLITNIGKAHLEGFGSFDGVVATKKELYDFLITNESVIFACADNQILTKILNGKSYIKYGIQKDYDCYGKILRNTAFLNADITLKEIASNYSKNADSNHFNVSSNLIGDYNLENLLAAVTVGYYFGVSSKKIAEAVSEYQPDNNRSQLKKTLKNTLILDAYNANPSSMTLAIKNFALMDVENKVLVLGDMLELGEYAKQEHLSIVELVVQLNFKDVFLVGKIFSGIFSNFKFQTFENSDKLCDYIREYPIENKNILIKGSRGIKLEKIIELL